jgi:acetyl esterase/lipase
MQPVAHSDGEDRSVLHRTQTQPAFTLTYGPHPDHVAEVFQPSSPATRWVIGLHGGFWRPAFDRIHLRNTAAALASQGVLSVLVEYRRIPGQPYTMVDDVCRALDVLQADHDHLQTPPSSPTVWGHSAGGHLALIVGQRRPTALAGVVALAPVTNLRQAEEENLGKGAVTEFLGGPALSYSDIDPAQHPKPDLPITLIHGARDSIVPVRQSEALRVRWPDSECITLPDAGHFEVIDPQSSAWPTVVAEITR